MRPLIPMEREGVARVFANNKIVVMSDRSTVIQCRARRVSGAFSSPAAADVGNISTSACASTNTDRLLLLSFLKRSGDNVKVGPCLGLTGKFTCSVCIRVCSCVRMHAMALEAYIVAGDTYTRCARAQDVIDGSNPSVKRRKRSIVVPTVCMGNVAQLAVDLLLAGIRQRVEHVAMLRHPLVLPCFGVNPYVPREGAGGITSHAAHPLDLYRLVTSEGGDGVDVRDVYVVQQRAPASAGCQAAFSGDLMAWVREAGFDEVWILGSLSAEYRKDRDITLAPAEEVKYVCGDESGMGSRCAGAGMSRLGTEYGEIEHSEEVLMPWALMKAAGVTVDGTGGAASGGVGGVAEAEAGGVPAAAVLRFVMEGDNRVDAVIMARAVGQLLGVEVSARVPSSWAVE